MTTTPPTLFDVFPIRPGSPIVQPKPGLIRLLVAGSRDGIRYRTVEREMLRWMRYDGEAHRDPVRIPTEIVHGGASGVDTFAEYLATDLRIPVRVFPADWKTFGKSAGPRRNAEMARYATHALVIHHGSRGSLDMVKRARAKGLDVTEVRVEWESAP